MSGLVGRDASDLLRIIAWPMINIAEPGRLAGPADFA
jgi:hypothetical protein